MGWKIIISPSAEADLENIVCYVARHNSDAAARLGFELITCAEQVADFPEKGRVGPEFKKPNIREVICRSYRVIYLVNSHDQRIEIIRFWHGARGFPQIPGEQ